MPIKNGFQVIKFIKENKKFQHIPVVALSSMTNLGVVDKIKRLGAANLINKSDLVELHKYIELTFEDDDFVV
jgi:two-component system chemotaxis response regulator CheV